MFHEGCTIEEIEAYRELESESFDFGEGEMKIEGWYGSEDAYYKLSLVEGYRFLQTCLDYKQNKHNCKKQKLNNYEKKQIDKKKVMKLSQTSSWWTFGRCETHLYRVYRKRKSKTLKKISNKRARTYELHGKNNNYRRVFNFWWFLL